ncbi:MAG: AAA family ATPase [Candidatus Thiosymbion ectosymbiont of Robbea hypermnestra]|nr:AAA family ATPase [Candidatus Thiosymbion ectosymbiont of Robbea hypermnestra]
MHITRIGIDNFKSLVDFDLPLAKLTCLIGLNGAGKSTVIQGLDFVAQLFRGDLSHWLGERNWNAADLNSKLVSKSNIDLRIEAEIDTLLFVWTGSFNQASLRCTQESLEINGHMCYGVADGNLTIPWTHPPANGKITFKYQGSILSALTDEALPDPRTQQFRDFIRSITSLDLLSPQSLRRHADVSGGSLGLGGERLSAFVHELPSDKKIELRRQLRRCYPDIEDISTRSLQAGWKELSVYERFGSHGLRTEARHINDGMLRLMAILAETSTDGSFLLFDEIENGVNPELVEFLLDTLLQAPQQILVTTHSPMILNYLDDEVARAGVQYLYRGDDGRTRTVPFFSIPSLHKKLAVMGPGEAFVDTELSRLPEEIARMGGEDRG